MAVCGAFDEAFFGAFFGAIVEAGRVEVWLVLVWFIGGDVRSLERPT